MGRSRYIKDTAENEALVTAALNALKVDVVTTGTGILNTMETTLDAIETLLGGTAKVKIWDGTHTLDVDTDGKIPVSSTQLTTIDGVLDAIQALLEGTQLTKLWDGTQTLDIGADGTIPISGTVTVNQPVSIDDNSASITVDQGTPANLKTAVFGNFGGTPTAILVDTSGKLKVTF